MSRIYKLLFVAAFALPGCATQEKPSAMAIPVGRPIFKDGGASHQEPAVELVPKYSPPSRYSPIFPSSSYSPVANNPVHYRQPSYPVLASRAKPAYGTSLFTGSDSDSDTAFPIRRSGRTSRIGDTFYHSDGGRTSKIGDTYYHSDGGRTSKIGDTFYHSGGGRTSKIGDTYYHSNGGRSSMIGDTMYHSDGGRTSFIGNTAYHSGF